MYAQVIMSLRSYSNYWQPQMRLSVLALYRDCTRIDTFNLDFSVAPANVFRNLNPSNLPRRTEAKY